MSYDRAAYLYDNASPPEGPELPDACEECGGVLMEWAEDDGFCGCAIAVCATYVKEEDDEPCGHRVTVRCCRECAR